MYFGQREHALELDAHDSVHRLAHVEVGAIALEQDVHILDAQPGGVLLVEAIAPLERLLAKVVHLVVGGGELFNN